MRVVLHGVARREVEDFRERVAGVIFFRCLREVEEGSVIFCCCLREVEEGGRGRKKKEKEVAVVEFFFFLMVFNLIFFFSSIHSSPSISPCFRKRRDHVVGVYLAVGGIPRDARAET